MSLFVTVGTTSFDDLIRVVDSPSVKSELASKGFKEIICQIGQGSYIPSLPNVRTVPNLNDFINSSDLVIAHAGAGTILDVLRLHKKLIVVVNPKLMNNHQVEIAETLQKSSHLLMCAGPDQLLSVLTKLDLFIPVALPSPNTQAFMGDMLALLK